MDSETYENYQMQDAMTKNQMESQNLPYTPQLQEDLQRSQAVLVEQTNPRRIVKEIILRLRGLEERHDGTFVRMADPKMNKEGVDNMWFVLDSHINQGVVLSHLKIEEIGNLMKEIGKDIDRDLALNWKRYGIVKQTDLDVISNSVLVNIYMALKRAEGQNEKNWLGKISVEQISGGQRLPQMKKDSFWSKFRL